MIEDHFDKDFTLYKQIQLFDANETEYGEIVENWVAVEEGKTYMPDGPYSFNFTKEGITIASNTNLYLGYSENLENLDRLLIDGKFYQVNKKNIVYEASTNDFHHIEVELSQIDRMGNIVTVPITVLPRAIQSGTLIIRASLTKDLTYPFLLGSLNAGMYIKTIDISVHTEFNVGIITLSYNNEVVMSDDILRDLRYHQTYVDYQCDESGNISVNIPGTITSGEADVYIEVINA